MGNCLRMWPKLFQNIEEMEKNHGRKLKILSMTALGGTEFRN